MGEMDPMEEGRKLVAEFIGTFALIFIGAGAVITTTGRADGLIAVALAYGLAMALLLSALGHISGGFFNPSLTIGLWATRRLDSITTVAYIIAQLLGAVVAALALYVLLPEVLRNNDGNFGVPGLGFDINFLQGVGLEAIATFFLMLAVFGTALDKRGPSIGGFGIGLVITMDIFAIRALTGAAMNPARAFGPALIDNTWDDHLVYWIGPILGAVIAALVYHYLFAEEPEAAYAPA